MSNLCFSYVGSSNLTECGYTSKQYDCIKLFSLNSVENIKMVQFWLCPHRTTDTKMSRVQFETYSVFYNASLSCQPEQKTKVIGKAVSTKWGISELCVPALFLKDVTICVGGLSSSMTWWNLWGKRDDHQINVGESRKQRDGRANCMTVGAENAKWQQ